MIQIALIGAGQIGSRHLQALALLDIPARIFVVDPSTASLQTANERHNEVRKPDAEDNIFYATTMEFLPEELDVAIIATSADGRLEVLRQLLDNTKVKYLILEKVVFNVSSHFEVAGELLRNAGCTAFVNCTRRVHGIYQDLRRIFHRSNIIEFAVEGPLWDIGCNGIHFLDLFSFLSGDSVDRLNSAFLDPDIHPSKRDGYDAFYGTVIGSSAKDAILRLSSFDASVQKEMRINIISDNAIANVDETNGSAILRQKEDGWAETIIPFKMLYQSQLSHIIVEQLISNGACMLTPFDECVNNHVQIIKALNSYIGNAEDCRCPIT